MEICLSKSLESHWANPINLKNYIRRKNQAKAVNEVLNALKPSQIDTSGQLHVVNWSEYHHCFVFHNAREAVALDSGFTDGLPDRKSMTSIYG